MRSSVPLVAASFVLTLSGLFCANQLVPPHPAWTVAYLAAYGFTHAVTLCAVGFAAGSALAAARFPGARAVATGVVALFLVGVVVDALAYGIVGLHIDPNSIGYALQARAMTTLGLHTRDFAMVGAVAVLLGWIVHRGLHAAEWRALARVALVALCFDAAFAAANAVFRFEGYQPALGLADAMPLAWRPTWEPFLARVLGHPVQGTDAETPFPEPHFRDLSSRTLRGSAQPVRARVTPDVLLVVVESLRADALEQMPNLRAWAESSLTARQHVSSGNCTFLGMFSLLSGLEPSYWGVRGADRAPRGLGAFVSLGYQLELERGMGTDFDMAARVAPAKGTSLFSVPGATPAERDDEAVSWTLQWLRSKSAKPRFALVFLESTHWPYETPRDPERIPIVNSWAGRELVDRMRGRYADAVRASDERIGRILRGVHDAGRERDLIVVATGDHGEAFREHGVFSHGGRLDEEQLRVPFAVRFPGAGPQVITARTTHADVLPTVLGWMGAEPRASTAGAGVDWLSGEQRSSPPVSGFCGIQGTRGYAAYDGEEKILVQVDDDGGHVAGSLGPGDLRRAFAPASAPAVAAAVARSANALLAE